jgi:hypothetical protein
VLLASLAGCGKSEPPRCPQASSLMDLCSVITPNPCPLLWSAVQTDHAYCAACATEAWSAGSCGGYDVLFNATFAARLYYDEASGKLVGAAEGPGPGAPCLSAPGVAFGVPDCGSSVIGQLPGWCSSDSAADAGARAFPCCQNTVDACVQAPFPCATTWRDSQTSLAEFCPPDTNYTGEQAGTCGDYDVLRFTDGTTERTFYYETVTGALVAEIEGDLLCDYGPLSGLTLPVCPPTLPSICPDGGVDGG